MPHPVDIHVGHRLRALRKTAGISQESLAKKLGMTFQQVQKYEKGSNRVSASKLFEAAQFLGIEIGDFFTGLPRDIGDSASNGSAAAEVIPIKISPAIGLRRLVTLYNGLANDAERERLVKTAEVLAQPLTAEPAD